MKSKTKNNILAVVVSAIAIFVPSFLFAKWVEGIVFFICHWLIRPQFPKQYHHILHAMCRLITSIVFFFGVSFVLPLSLSLVSAIPINYLIGWVGFTKKQADEYEVKYTKLKAQLEKKKEFNVDTCTEAELIERCRELRFSAENTELCIDLFIRKIKQSDIADKLCIEEKSIQQRKRRFRQKLNKK
jgi:hypothetical protein